MSFGLELYKESGVLALNTNANNMFIADSRTYAVPAENPNWAGNPYGLLTGMPSFGNSDTCPMSIAIPASYTSFVRPIPMVAFTVGARMWDVWFMPYGDDAISSSAMIPDAADPSGSANPLYDYQKVSYKILNATSVTVLSLQTVSKTDELGNNFIGYTVPNDAYGLEVFNAGGQRVWTTAIQTVNITNILTLDIEQLYNNFSASSMTILTWHIIAPRALLPHEDFYITPTMVGNLTHPLLNPKLSLLLERVSDVEYVLKMAYFDYLVDNSAAYAAIYPEWVGLGRPTFVGTDERQELNRTKIQFIAGIMDK